MKPSDVQQMMQRYKLIVEENGNDAFKEQFDELNNDVRQIINQLSVKVDAMRTFIEYAESFDFEMDFTTWAENWDDVCHNIFR